MNQLKKLCLCFMLIFFVNCVAKSTTSRYNPLQNELASSASETIFEFLNENSKSLQWGYWKDVIMILGNTGYDKVLLSSFLIGENLKVIESSPVNYVIADRFGKIKKNPELIVPKLKTDPGTLVEHYVLPDFSSMIDAKHDLSVSYYIQRVLNFAERVKFVFTIDYSVIKDGKNVKAEQKLELSEFVSNATKLLKNMDKFRNSIALVIMNFKEDPNTDKKIIMDKISNMFELIQSEFIDDPEKIEFINILLEKTEKKFKRIAIFKQPNQTGSINDIPSMQYNKNEISYIVYSSIEYTSTENNEFGLISSPRLNKHLPDLIKEVRKQLIAVMSKFGRELKRNFKYQQSKLKDLHILYELSKKFFQEIVQLNEYDSYLFSKNLLHAVKSLDIDISINNLNEILEIIQLFSFLTSLRDRYEPIFIPKALMKTTQYFNDTVSFYELALNFRETLSEHRVQKNPSNYRVEQMNISNLKKLLRQLKINTNHKIDYTKDVFNLKLLELVYNQTLNDNGDTSCENDMLIVKGSNVKISDVANNECMKTAKIIQVFASDKLIIDADIDKTGEQAMIAFIATTWEVVGDRKIILEGVPGENLKPNDDPPAENGEGVLGEPGLPGGPAGSFLGVGDTFINANQLNIRVNGGKGGQGQSGGRGLYFSSFFFSSKPSTLLKLNFIVINFIQICVTNYIQYYIIINANLK